MKRSEVKVGDEVVMIQDTARSTIPIGTVLSVVQLESDTVYVQNITDPDMVQYQNNMMPSGARRGYTAWVYYTDLEPKETSIGSVPVSLESVVMTDEKRLEIKSAISQIDNQKKIFEDWGFAEVLEKGRAVTLLFYGIPGTGKTLTAQAIADELKAELKIYSTAEIESMEPGGPERMIKSIFAEAKKIFKAKKKRVLLFDECDSLLMDRNEVGPIIGAQINVLLSEIEKHEGVIIFTTNRLGKLDPALERRVSAKIEFEFPDKDQRQRIWKRLIPSKAPLNNDVDFDKLADYPLAGGNIKNAVLNAARKAAYENSETITFEHFRVAIEKEAESVQAFIAAYEDTAHSNVVGYSRGVGKISAGKTMHKQKVIAEDEKKNDGILSNFFSNKPVGGHK